MSMVIKLTALGVSLMFSLGACANLVDEPDTVPGHHERCDHVGPKEHTVVVTMPRDKAKEPSVNRKYVVACSGDKIVFKGKRDTNFSIKFKPPGSPFGGGDLTSTNGEAPGTVSAEPQSRSKFFKYNVKDNLEELRPELDPRIIITPR